jgi:hypothetical protein
MGILSSNRFSMGRNLGGLASVLGIIAGIFLLIGPTGRYETVTSDGTIETGTTSGIDYLFGAEHADPALFFWALCVLGFTIVGGYGVWTGNRHVVWAIGLGLLALSVLGILSIGLFVAPAALLFLGSGVLLTLSHRTDAT